MVVFSRQVNEGICIRDDIEVLVDAIDGNKVSLRASGVESLEWTTPEEKPTLVLPDADGFTRVTCALNDSLAFPPKIDVVIQIVDFRSTKVRLAIHSPPTTSVHRKEVYDLIRRAEEESR